MSRDEARVDRISEFVEQILVHGIYEVIVVTPVGR